MVKWHRDVILWYVSMTCHYMALPVITCMVKRRCDMAFHVLTHRIMMWHFHYMAFHAISLHYINVTYGLMICHDITCHYTAFSHDITCRHMRSWTALWCGNYYICGIPCGRQKLDESCYAMTTINRHYIWEMTWSIAWQVTWFVDWSKHSFSSYDEAIWMIQWI